MNRFRRKAKQTAGAERKISFLISPSWGARTLHWSLPVWAARVFMVGMSIFLLLLMLVAVHYGLLLGDAREAQVLREENAALREHYQKLMILETELANLSEELAQLRWIAGLDVYADQGSDEYEQDYEEELPDGQSLESRAP